jgi:hypothetical protein
MIGILGICAQLALAGAPARAIDTLATRVAAPVDTPRTRAVEVSDWYGRRLTLHRWLSYTTYPLFAFQYAAGRQKWDRGDAAPAWAKDGHVIGATAIATVFTANTVTGVWNLIESRHVEDGRTRRYLHGASMLVADAGFTWAGAVLSEQAERSNSKRKLHRTVALTSIGISVTSSTLMWIFNR